MALTDAYLLTTKNLEAFLNSIQVAQAPEKFTYTFLQQLEFKSTNDRLFIKLLKELKFVDDAGIPLDRYYKFLDSSEAPKVLAEAIKDSFSELFTINKKAWQLSEEDVKNKLRTLTQGKRSDKVITLTAKTFKALCDNADWTISSSPKVQKSPDEQNPNNTKSTESSPSEAQDKIGLKGGLHYNIQIHLPESRDVKVYEAIFESLKRHLT